MKNTFGAAVTVTIFGESHGPAIGAVVDGLSAGLAVDEAFIARQMDRRRARKDGLSTPRTEADRVRILSGVKAGFTTGTPVTLLIENTNARPEDYGAPGPARPGHADWAAQQKYGGWQDHRGGGHFSGRITAALTAAGALCQSVLAAKGIEIATHIRQIAGVQDSPFETLEAGLAGQLAAMRQQDGFPVLDGAAGLAMQQVIRDAAARGDSVGGVLETAALGLPGGLGEPFFDSVESVLSHLLFSIPAVKGVEFGAGFGFAAMTGSTANDPLRLKEGRITALTNHSGGINGGVTNSMPLILRSCIRPTPSIFKEQQTVDLTTGREVTLQLKGRHDPCILHRAAVVQTAAVAIGLLDLCTQRFGTIWQKEG